MRPWAGAWPPIAVPEFASGIAVINVVSSVHRVAAAVPLVRSLESHRPRDQVREPCRKDDERRPGELAQSRDLRQARRQEMFPCTDAHVHQIGWIAVMFCQPC